MYRHNRQGPYSNENQVKVACKRATGEPSKITNGSLMFEKSGKFDVVQPVSIYPSPSELYDNDLVVNGSRESAINILVVG